mgnify:CR=1 FL=1
MPEPARATIKYNYVISMSRIELSKNIIAFDIKIPYFLSGRLIVGVVFGLLNLKLAYSNPLIPNLPFLDCHLR